MKRTVPLSELCRRYITARPRMSTSYRKTLRRVVRGLEWAAGRLVYADQLDGEMIDAWAAAERARVAEGTVAAFVNMARALWGEAWTLGLNDHKPSDSTHWIEEDGDRRVARGALPGTGSPPRGPTSAEKDCPDGSLRQLFRESYIPRKLRSKSPNAVRLHENTLNNFERFLGRTARIADLDDDVVTSFLAWLRAIPRAPATVNNNRFRLLALWRFAARKRLVENWPDVELEPEPKRIPRAWTVEELRRLFAACAAARGTVDGIPAGQWWLLLHLLIWDTGERISAILAARWDWFDVATSVLSVPAEARKGNREDRRYPLHPETVKLLADVRKPAREIIVPWPNGPDKLYYAYGKIQRKAGLPQGRMFRFHCLRKAVASHGAAMGLDPRQLMGHIDGKVTAKYLDPAIVGQAPSGSALFRPLIGTGNGGAT